METGLGPDHVQGVWKTDEGVEETRENQEEIKMSKIRVYGWVLTTKGATHLFCLYGKGDTTKQIKNAYVYHSRAVVREFKFNDEVIRRVSLDCRGNAVAVVSGR